MIVLKLNKVKDALLSKSIITIINVYIQEYGKLLNFNLNSLDKTIHITILLKGESDPISIDIENYSLLSENNVSHLRFDNISTSRLWMNLLLDNYLDLIINNNQIEIPYKIAKILNVMI